MWMHWNLSKAWKAVCQTSKDLQVLITFPGHRATDTDQPAKCLLKNILKVWHLHNRVLGGIMYYSHITTSRLLKTYIDYLKMKWFPRGQTRSFLLHIPTCRGSAIKVQLSSMETVFLWWFSSEGMWGENTRFTNYIPVVVFDRSAASSTAFRRAPEQEIQLIQMSVNSKWSYCVNSPNWCNTRTFTKAGVKVSPFCQMHFYLQS